MAEIDLARFARANAEARPRFSGRETQTIGHILPLVLVVALAGFAVFVSGPHTLLALLAFVVLGVGTLLTWRPRETPILFFVFAFQWLEVSILVFYANLVDKPLNELVWTGADMVPATYLSLIGLLMFTIGMRIFAGAAKPEILNLVNIHIDRVPQKRFAQLYFGALLLELIAEFTASTEPSLAQPLLALARLKWAAYVLLTIVSFKRKDANKILWLAVFLFEFAVAVGGFFSTFKLILVMTFLAVLIASPRIPIRQSIFAGTLSVAALLAATTWEAVKVDYRSFVNRGEQTQVVAVGYPERMSKLSDLVANLNGEQMTDGFYALVRRLSYVEFFGAVLNHVPAIKKHTEGALWWDAISRPFMPRVLFPSKTAVHDSAHTTEYTGLRVAGVEEGASISIGYFGDTYIDFGRYGMMVALFLFGGMLGLIYRWLLYGSRTRGLIGVGLSSASLIVASSVGNSLGKLFAVVVLACIAAWLAYRILIPTFAPWLQSTTRTPVRRRFTSASAK